MGVPGYFLQEDLDCTSFDWNHASWWIHTSFGRWQGWSDDVAWRRISQPEVFTSTDELPDCLFDETISAHDIQQGAVGKCAAPPPPVVERFRGRSRC